MTHKTNTIAGPFDRARLKTLTDTLEAADAEGLDPRAIIKFEGQDLVLQFGRYLAEHVETELTKLEDGGL